MRSHESKLISVRDEMTRLIKTCTKCKECKVDTKVAFGMKIPEVVISNINTCIECSECSEMKSIMNNEPQRDLSFFKAMPRGLIRQHYNDYGVFNEKQYIELYSLYVLSYYYTRLYNFTGSSRWHDMFCIYGFDTSDFLERVINPSLSFYSDAVDFDKSLIGKKICICHSIIAIKGMKKHIESKKHIDFVNRPIVDLYWDMRLDQMVRGVRDY
jgi:hypothetical protein